MFTMNGSRDALNDEYAAKVWPAILYLSIVMVTGSLGNAVVCVVYWFDLSKVNNRFVLALAGIDLVNCLISIPGDIADMRYNYSFGDSYYCIIKGCTVTFCSMASASILGAISVERFQKIYKPYGRQTTLQTSIAAIFTSILLALVCAIPTAIGESTTTGYVHGVPTVECQRGDTFFNKIYNILLFLLFILGCLILVILYSFIWHRLRKQRYFRNQLHCQTLKTNHKVSTVQVNQACSEKVDGENSNNKSFPENISTKSTSLTSTSEPISVALTSKYSQSQSSCVTPLSKSTSLATVSLELSPDVNRADEESDNPPSKENDRRKRTGKMKTLSPSTKVDKTTIIMLVVTVVYILSFLPYLCLTTTSDIYPESFQNLTNVQLASYELFYRSHYLNSALNPFIYSFLNLQFREQLGSLRNGFVMKFGRG